MIRVKYKTKKVLNELEKGSYQEKFTADIGGESKTLLNSLFEGKTRILIPFNIPLDVFDDSSSLESYIDDHSNSISDRLYNLYADPTPNERPEVTAKKEKIRQDPVRNFLIDLIAKKYLRSNPEEKKEKIVERYKQLMNDYFSKIYSCGQYTGIEVKTDFNKKLITLIDSGGKKKDIRLSVFMENLTKASKALADIAVKYKQQGNNIQVNLNEKREYFKFIFRMDNLDIIRFVKYFVSSTEQLNEETFAQKMIAIKHYIQPDISFDETDEDEVKKYYNNTVGRNDGIHKLAVKYLFDYSMTNASPYIVITRVPRDVVRMSDFEFLKSCHAPVYSTDTKKEKEDKMYSSCATQEAISKGGAVAYLFQSIPQELLSTIESSNEEFMKDDRRGIAGPTPITRLRIRTIGILVNGEEKEILHVPDSKLFGRTYVQFNDAIKSMLLSKQADVLGRIKQFNKDEIKYKLYGGAYPDVALLKSIAAFIGDSAKEQSVFAQSEYPRNYVSPSSNLSVPYIQHEYEDKVREIVNKYNLDDSLVFFSAEADVDSDPTDASDTGYFTGHPRPYEVDPSLDEVVAVGIVYKVNPFSVISEIERFHGVELTREEKVNHVKYEIEKGGLFLKDILSKGGYRFKNYKKTSYEGADPQKVISALEKDVKDAFLVSKYIKEVCRSPELIKKYFGIDVKPQQVSELKSYFKRLL